MNIDLKIIPLKIKSVFQWTGDVTIKFKSDHSYAYNVITGTTPVVVHGNGPIKVSHWLWTWDLNYCNISSTCRYTYIYVFRIYIMKLDDSFSAWIQQICQLPGRWMDNSKWLSGLQGRDNIYQGVEGKN